MERRLVIRKFRNIGFDSEQSLLLNSDFEKGHVGNLLVVIGANNSGKSNVLDALSKINPDYVITDRDITDLSYLDEDRIPEVSLRYKDDNEYCEYKISLNHKPRIFSNVKDIKVDLPSKDIINSEIEEISLLFSNMYGRNFEMKSELLKKINSENVDEETLSKCIVRLFDYVKQFRPNYYGADYNGFMEQLKNKNFETLVYYNYLKGNSDGLAENYIKDKTGLSFIPNVYKYKETTLNKDDLYIRDIKKIENSRFFKSLFKIMDEDMKIVVNAYDEFDRKHNSAILNKLEKHFLKKLEQINERFNKMYLVSEDKYKFTLRFDSSEINFGIARGKNEDPLTIEYQSVGFKWFFNFYFNFIGANKLKAGDIVLMDEPATNLSPDGQQELRQFIKDFAIKNDVLFVIATQSPFLVDPDNYDELRVVTMENNRSKIDNSFTAVNLNDPDSLAPIKLSLAIKQNVLYDIDTIVCWVEGITDYNYLTLFKKELGYTNITFLPFNGVGDDPEKTKEILKKITSIKFSKYALLVDGDKAGRDMYNQAENTIFKDRRHKVSEVKYLDGKSPMTIEDLFSKDEIKKLKLVVEKNGPHSSFIKTYFTKDDFSESTINNFKQLFDLIID